MIHIVLIKPEIPPNTGNIIRLCANTGYYLHLVKPLGFDLSDRNLIRAGLDYHDLTKLQIHNSLNEFVNLIKPNRLLGTTAKGNKNYTKINFEKNDAILFGSESIGLDKETLDSIPKENQETVEL